MCQAVKGPKTDSLSVKFMDWSPETHKGPDQREIENKK